MPEELEIIISPDGKTSVHIKGTKGKGCADVSRALGNALGRVEKTERTSEYYEQPVEAKRKVSA